MPRDAPVISPEAFVASSAVLAGPVSVGPGCAIDHGAVLVATGAPITLGKRVVVTPGAIIRSTGGADRSAQPVTIGDDCLVGPQAVLTGCELGDAVYVATQVMVFHGAQIGAGSRLGAGSIVHTGTHLAPGSRVGMRQIAVPSQDGPVITSDLDVARRFLAEADFFGRVFGADENEQDNLMALHTRTARVVADEMRSR